MKRLKFTLLAITLSLACSAMAEDFTVQHIGSFDYITGSNGSSYTGQQIGSFYYLDGQDACGHQISGTEQRIGSFEYWDFDQD